jgi:dTDP-glucose 4,6-dehydratase
MNPSAVVRVAGVPISGAAPLRYVPSVNRAKQLLGLEQTVSLEESIRRTAAWYSQE